MRASTAVAAAIVVAAGLSLGGIAQRDRIARLPSALQAGAAAPTSRALPIATMSATLLAEAASTSNVYARPDRSAQLVAVLPGGQHAAVTGRSQDAEWLYIATPPTSGLRGWTASAALRLESSVVAALPVVPVPPLATPTPLSTVAPALEGALPDPALAEALLRPGGQLEVSIKNAGVAELVDVTLTLSVSKVGGEEVTMFRIGPASLLPGATAMAIPPLTLTEPGRYRLELGAAPEMPDADPANNVLELMLTP